MKAKLTFLAVIGIALFLELTPLGNGHASDALIETLPTGYIEWSAGTVRASGVGLPSSNSGDQRPPSAAHIQDAARQMAHQHLLATVGAVRINTALSVADRVFKNPAFRDGMATLAHNAAVTRQEYLSDGTLEIELTMSLTGGFGQFVLPQEIRQVEAVTTMSDPSVKTNSAADADDSTKKNPHTGLIIDATGIQAKPSLVPVVVDESGEVVYGPAFVSREFAVSRGMSGYATSVAAAREDKRIGTQPLVIKAIRTRATGPTDLVIANTDAARLRSSVVHLNFLRACRVMIVMDPILEASP